MPARRTNGSKYSKDFNNEIVIRTIDVLHHSTIPLTISDICSQDMVLTGITSQKMSRVLSDLCKMGIAVKAKSKSKNRMVYASVEILEEQGYDISKLVVT